MDNKRRRLGTAAVAGCLATLGLLAVIGLAVVYTGAYNVAATEEHTSIARWAFDTTLHRSVESRAAEVPRAEAVTPAMLASGAGAYRAMCQHCHGGPGVQRAEWANGMRPRPPYLVEAAAEWQPHEVFWIAKHGIKMTGMPAFGPTHDDRALWGIAAFVKALPAMTPEQYRSLGEQAGKEATQDGSGGGHHPSGSPHSHGQAGGSGASTPGNPGR